MSRGARRRENRWKLHDDPKKKVARIPGLPKVARSAGRVEHTEWAKALIARHGLEKAIQITRKLAVDVHIGTRKTSEPNLQKWFYRSAFNWMKKKYNANRAPVMGETRAQAQATPEVL